MNCNACKRVFMDTKELMKCSLCVRKFHINCLNLDKKQFLSLSKEYKSSWVCPACMKAIPRRNRCHDDTPIGKNTSATTVFDDTMNMSCDLSDAATPSGPASTTSPVAPNATEEVTMAKISSLLDERLNASLSGFAVSFRKALRDDVREMVKAELESVIGAIKEEFSATTDFICAEQKTIQLDIQKNDSIIKNLEHENTKLQSELTRLNSRLAGMEKISRSCNLELQAVPERRNENVMTLFRKLCEVVKVSVDDGQVNGCRRVAKRSSTSNRPRNIVITFSSQRIRDSVLSATHRFNKAHPGRGLVSSDLDITGETSRIFVTEHLSPEQKTLHAATRIAAKDNGYKYVWIKFGQIYVLT